MEALDRVPLSRRAADALLDDVTSGRWEIGARLPGEVALAKELGVGRSTVREAIRLLAAQGVLTPRQGIGVFLTSTSGAEPWDQIAKAARIDDIIQVRIAIESRAAALAAERRDHAALARIRQALAARRAVPVTDSSAFARADVEFHRTVVEAAGNEPLTSLFVSIQDRVIDAMAELVEWAGVVDLDEENHAAVVEAIVSGDADRAEQMTREHLIELGRPISQERSTRDPVRTVGRAPSR